MDVDTITLVYHDAFTSANMHVERPRADTFQEPQKLFIKFPDEEEADLDAFRHLLLSKQGEAELGAVFGLSGMGPEMYGTFQTQDETFGRIDELVDGRNLTAADVEDAAIRVDIARALATFHTTKLQLEEKSVEAYYAVIIGALEKYCGSDELKALTETNYANFDGLINYDFAGRILKVIERMAALGGKQSWCLHDVQYSNVLVKNNPAPNESRVCLVDFEFTMRNYRGLDIGGHFLNKLFWWPVDKTQFANARPFTLEEKQQFCNEYARQWNDITGDADTGDQILLEAECGYLLAIAFHIHGMLICSEGKKWTNNEQLEFSKLCNEFLKQFLDLGLDDTSYLSIYSIL